MTTSSIPTDHSRDLSELVTTIFRRWREEGVAFLVLRNYENLPYDTGNDIDVLVRPAQLQQAEEVLVAAARAAGYRLHNRAEFSPVSLFFHKTGSIEQIQVDLFFSLQWRGFDFLSADAVLDRRVIRGDFSVPHPIHEAMAGLLTRLVFHGYVKDAYKQFILTHTSQQPAKMKAALASAFGAPLAAKVTHAILAGQWSEVEGCFGAMRRQLVLRRLLFHPFHTLGSIFRDFRRFAHRLVRPPGLMVVLMGPDGCGKSTVAELLWDSLGHTFRGDKGLRVHWKPSVLFRSRRATRPPTTSPHGVPPRPAIVSLVFLVYHWLEYLLGSLLQSLPVRFRNGLVLIDRFHYDFVVDPWRYRLNVPLGLVRFLFRFVPSPDLVFLLDAPAETLHSRKKEVTIEETRRQLEAYRALAETLPNAKIISAMRPANEVAHEIAGNILSHLEARHRRWSGRG